VRRRPWPRRRRNSDQGRHDQPEQLVPAVRHHPKRALPHPRQRLHRQRGCRFARKRPANSDRDKARAASSVMPAAPAANVS
jgi:hypothetical protein